MTSVCADSPPLISVSVEQVQVIAESSGGDVSVTKEVNVVEVTVPETTVVEVDGNSPGVINDNPYLPVKRLREIGPTVARLSYDDDGNLVAKAYDDAETLNYFYDNNGNLTEVTDGKYTTALEYDDDGNLSSVTRS
jgi:YD repeat-containing protein